MMSGVLEPSRRTAIVVGLTALAMLVGLEDQGHQVPIPALAGWTVVALLLLAERYRPDLVRAVPDRFRGGGLVAGAALLLAYVALLQIQFAPAALVWWAATVLFVRGASRDGHLSMIQPRRAVAGWPRRIVTLGAVLVVVSMSSRWLGDLHYGYAVGDWYTRGTIGGATANALGRAALPTAVALGALLVAAWDEASAWWPRMRTAVPVGAGVLGAVALRAMIADSRHFEEVTRGGSAYALAAGPWVLFTAAIVLGAGGLLLRRVGRRVPVPPPGS